MSYNNQYGQPPQDPYGASGQQSWGGSGPAVPGGEAYGGAVVPHAYGQNSYPPPGAGPQYGAPNSYGPPPGAYGAYGPIGPAQKDTTTAFLLWFFLGWLGIHNFYLGRTGPGIAQAALYIIGWVTSFLIIGWFLLVAWFIWWVIDAFMISGIVRQANYQAGGGYPQPW